MEFLMNQKWVKDYYSIISNLLILLAEILIYKMKKLAITIIILIFCVQLFGQIPPGYYNTAQGLTGTQLKTALHNIIDNHTSVSYSSIWTHVQTTDKKTNNKVWDMYSDIPGGTPPYQFTFSTHQCSGSLNYTQEGDCYNREHSWPQSWFSSASPMKTDLFHVYPTDGYVNGQRGSYPFGEVLSPTWTSLNGSKKGNCDSQLGYSGIVFEPIDEYKGDFARTYFYMSVRYFNEDSGWANNAMVNGAVIKTWALNMLLQWHLNDTVSLKEIARNNAVYGIQSNRNPFIDHPEYAGQIWGTPSKSNLNPNEFLRINIYPNPAKEFCKIEILGCDLDNIHVLMYNSIGKQIDIKSSCRKNEIKINTKNLPSGIYLLSVRDYENNTQKTKKLFIQ